jgi:hypothetical protein
MLTVQQNSTRPFNVYFGVSGLTVTATLSKNGEVFHSVSPTITDRSNGYYSIAPIAAHRDTLGENAWLFSASGQPSLPRVEQVTAADVDAVAYGANTVTPPSLAAIEGSTVLAKEATVATRASAADVINNSNPRAF